MNGRSPVGARRIKTLAKEALPTSLKRFARSTQRRLQVWPAVGFVRYGSFRRIEPMAQMWPPRYVTPIDRLYIEPFLERHLASAHGHVLEVGDLDYTNRFGGPAILERSILHSPIGAGPSAHYVADLADGSNLPTAHFDVVVLPQTLLFIYDVPAAVATLHRILRPGGTLLVTVPGISHIVPDDRDQWGQFWSFTEDSLRRLLGDAFGDNVDITSHGNVLTAVAFLHGLDAKDLPRRALAYDDANYPLVLTGVATRGL